MDDLDRKILALLAKNARMPVKEIAEKVALTSPAVSSRIHKLETDGIISGYTVMLNRPADRVYVDALISLSVGASMILLFVVATSAQNRELAVSERTKEQIRQRLEIARALTYRTPLLILDEATSALDPETTASVLALLADINQRLNLTIVLITHELEVVKTLCDHAALLEHGEVVESGKIADLLVAPWSRLRQSLLHNPQAEQDFTGGHYA